MTPDEELLLIFGALHLVALVFGAVLFAMFLRSGSRPERRPPDDDDHGGGGNDRIGRRPKPPPPGGIPLPDADPSAARLRSHETLRDAQRRRDRRRVAEPAQPARRRVVR